MPKNKLYKNSKKVCKHSNKRIKKINKVFNKDFIRAVETIHKTKGKVVCSGVGKSGLIARKVSASSSVGISSFFQIQIQLYTGISVKSIEEISCLSFLTQVTHQSYQLIKIRK